MTIGNALPFKLNAGALDRLLKPGQIIIDDSINAYISSLEEQMHVDRCFVWHTYMHTHICEKYWNPLPDGDIDDFFQVRILAAMRAITETYPAACQDLRVRSPGFSSLRCFSHRHSVCRGFPQYANEMRGVLRPGALRRRQTSSATAGKYQPWTQCQC